MHNPRLKSDPAPRALVVLHSLLLDLLCLLLHPLLQQMLLASFLGLPSVAVLAVPLPLDQPLLLAV